MNRNLIFYGILLIFGIGLIGYAVQMMQVTNRLAEGGVKTTATLVEIKKTTDINGMDMYQPIFEFADTSNQMIRHHYDQMSSPPTWAVGQKIPVVYNPRNTAEVKLDKGFDLIGMPTLLFLLGLVLVILGLKHFLIR